jgi:hypothetical protein
LDQITTDLSRYNQKNDDTTNETKGKKSKKKKGTEAIIGTKTFGERRRLFRCYFDITDDCWVAVDEVWTGPSTGGPIMSGLSTLQLIEYWNRRGIFSTMASEDSDIQTDADTATVRGGRGRGRGRGRGAGNGAKSYHGRKGNQNPCEQESSAAGLSILAYVDTLTGTREVIELSQRFPDSRSAVEEFFEELFHQIEVRLEVQLHGGKKFLARREGDERMGELFECLSLLSFIFCLLFFTVSK